MRITDLTIEEAQREVTKRYLRDAVFHYRLDLLNLHFHRGIATEETVQAWGLALLMAEADPMTGELL